MLVEKNDKDIFVLRFAYQIKADLNLEEQEKWMKLKLWTVECVVVQGDYVVIDREKNDDRVTFILHEHMHPFSKNQCEIGSHDAGPSILQGNFKTTHLGQASGLGDS